MKNLRELEKDYAFEIKNRGGKDFFSGQVSDMNQRPEMRRDLLDKAADAAEDETNEFLGNARNHLHPDHDKIVKQYKNDFGGDPAQVKKHFLNKFKNRFGVEDRQIRNLSYEGKVLNQYAPTTMLGATAISKYQEFIKNKWNAVGYDKDEQAITAFWEDHKDMVDDVRPASERHYAGGN